MTMIYDLQEGARNIKAMRNNKSNNISKVLQPHHFIPEPTSKMSIAKRITLKRQNDERIRQIEDNFTANQNKKRAEYNKRGFDLDGNQSPDKKFWKLKQFEDAGSKIDTRSNVGYRKKSDNRDLYYQVGNPTPISRNQSHNFKQSENLALLHRNKHIPLKQKGSHTLNKPSRNFDFQVQEQQLMAENRQSLQYADSLQQLPHTHSNRQIQNINQLKLSKASLKALDLQQQQHQTPFKKNVNLQEHGDVPYPGDENVFNLVSQNNQMAQKARETFYGLQNKLKPGRNVHYERERQYYTPTIDRGASIQDRYNSVQEGVILMSRQNQNHSTLAHRPQRLESIPNVAPRLERNVAPNPQQQYGIQLMQSYSQDQIAPYLDNKKLSNQNSARRLGLPSEEKYYDPAQMASKSKGGRNFVKENLHHVVFVQNKEAKQKKKERVRSEMKENMRSLDVNENFAKIPDYLLKYRQENDERTKKMIIREQIDKIPFGHRLVPEQERLETLKNLEDAQNEIVNTLERLPIISHHFRRSPQLESQKIDMEQKLIKIKNAIETYKRPPVYIAK